MQGITEKMRTQLSSPVQYQLVLNDKSIDLNPYLGKTIKLRFTGHIACVHCHKTIKKTFNQGYCYPCFIKLAQCDLCILKPETCHYEHGTCREPLWGETFCFQPHLVYLANSSGIKVGITRQTQIPTRWIDQGAVQALPIFRVTSRYLAGLIEVVLAKHVSDKTSWQKMLKAQPEFIDLVAQRDSLLALCEEELTQIRQQFAPEAMELLSDVPIVDIQFPIEHYPNKLKSFNFDQQCEVSGVLQGIKGQYLLLDTGVLNIRKFTGYELEFLADD
ncbi:MAG: DUF2797 domain-containing protein [Methylococcales bacterium]